MIPAKAYEATTEGKAMTNEPAPPRDKAADLDPGSVSSWLQTPHQVNPVESEPDWLVEAEAACRLFRIEPTPEILRILGGPDQVQP